MVGCETLTTKTNGCSATTHGGEAGSGLLDKTASSPGTGCTSGTAPGQIGTCVCPGDGCQTFVCALRLPHATTTQRAIIRIFFTSPQPIGFRRRWHSNNAELD